MKTIEDQTRIIEIFVAGDFDHSKQVVRRFCNKRPCCVTISPTAYIYRGGEEAGVVVGVRNYPRFPASEDELRSLANDLAELLRDTLGQDSCMTVDHAGVTSWSSTRQQ